MNKISLIFILLSLSSISCAESTVATDAEERAKASFSHLNEKVEVCEKMEQPFPIETLTALNIEKKILSTALTYYYLKSYTQCIDEEVKQFVLDISVTALLKKEDFSKISESSKIAVYSHVQYYEAKEKYNALPLDIKNKLNQVPELTIPFNLFKTSEQLWPMK